jgi:biopolymer transport protein ExbB/TolQ
MGVGSEVRLTLKEVAMETWELMLILLGVLMWVILMTAIMGAIKRVANYRRQFEQQLKDLESLSQQWDQIGVQEQASKQPQLAQAFWRLSQLQSQVNNITRQQHALRVSNLTGLAARAGITNWRP